jgi:hypothetical protein
MAEEAGTGTRINEELRSPRKNPGGSIYFGFLPVLLFLGLVIGLWLVPPALVI